MGIAEVCTLRQSELEEAPLQLRRILHGHDLDRLEHLNGEHIILCKVTIESEFHEMENPCVHVGTDDPLKTLGDVNKEKFLFHVWPCRTLQLEACLP